MQAHTKMYFWNCSEFNSTYFSDYFLLLFALDMMHPDVIPKPIVSMNVKRVDVMKVD